MSKKNLILGGVLIALLALAYIYQGPLKQWQKNYSREENILSNINTLDIDRIAISEGDNDIKLIKEGDQWRIDGTKDFIVRENIILALIDSLNRAKDVDVETISNNADKKAEFRTDDSGMHVSLMRGEELLDEFIIGNTTSDFSGTYISKPEVGKTYIFKTNMRVAFDRNDWYDDIIFATDKEKISKVRFQYPNREFTIERQGEGEDITWSGTLPYAFSVDDEKIDPVLDIMSNLTSAEIPEQDFDVTGLEKHTIIIEASGEGISNTLMVGDPSTEEAEFYYVKKGDSDNIYLITKEQRDELEKQIWDLR